MNFIITFYFTFTYTLRTQRKQIIELSIERNPNFFGGGQDPHLIWLPWRNFPTLAWKNTSGLLEIIFLRPWLKKFHQIDQKIIFNNSDGKTSFYSRIFSSHATDGIFHHQKRIILIDYGCPDGFFYSVSKKSENSKAAASFFYRHGQCEITSKRYYKGYLLKILPAKKRMGMDSFFYILGMTGSPVDWSPLSFNPCYFRYTIPLIR
jgi:hypothetical protein